MQQIYAWRGTDKLGAVAIASRLNTFHDAYPPPEEPAWTSAGVYSNLGDPRYTGYMIFGRTAPRAASVGASRPPNGSDHPEPAHPAIITRATFEAAQAIAAEHATSRDGYDTADGRRTYILRSRIRCASTAGACPAPTPRHPHRRRARHLLLLPHRPGNARHAAHPANVMVREDILLAAIRQFFDEHIFGPERAAILAAPLPRRRRRPGRHRAHDAAKLETRLRQIDAAEGHTQE